MSTRIVNMFFLIKKILNCKHFKNFFYLAFKLLKFIDTEILDVNLADFFQLENIPSSNSKSKEIILFNLI
jgi:hypothetical protein